MNLQGHELPPDREPFRRRAIRIEALTIVYLLSAIVVIYFTLGNSQAMKTAWIEDMLSLIPPIAFLVANRFRTRPPNERFPYGYHRSITIAFLCAALALLVFGGYLLGDALMKLVTAEHPSIGTVKLFGHQVWLGWLMLAALAYSGIPMYILGRIKQPVARTLHDKALFADAEMNRADWLSISAAMLGVLGIAVGLWWADAAAAAFISVEILRDGIGNLRTAVADLMDRTPTTVDHRAVDAMPRRVETELRKLPWVADARARLREEGHVFFGEVIVVPRDQRNLLDRIEETGEVLKGMDWRLHDVVVTMARDLEPTGPPP